jgi:hypothetical protein
MNFETAQKLDEHLKAIVSHANEALFIANNAGDDILRSMGSGLSLKHSRVFIDLKLLQIQ